MTIRKKILLFSALALGAFLAAVYLVSRFALLNGFARLENNYVRENIHHLQNEMQNEQSRLEIMARDYAQWDRTYGFMETRDPNYVRTELTDDTFKIIRVNVFALLDSSGRMVLHKSVGDWALDESDLRVIAGVPDSAQPRRVDHSGTNGILELRGRLLLVAYQPILTSRGAGRPRGTLVMARELDRTLIASLSRSVGSPLWLDTPEHAPGADSQGSSWSDGTNSVRFEGEQSRLEVVPIKDF